MRTRRRPVPTHVSHHALCHPLCTMVWLHVAQDTNELKVVPGCNRDFLFQSLWPLNSVDHHTGNESPESDPRIAGGGC